MFNGNVTTGCSYDPLTGNAMRSVTDLVVAGGMGAYPLAFSRTANSRAQSFQDFQFGAPGSWQHSYSWSIDDSDLVVGINNRPAAYTVNFPDGRVMIFSASSPDIYFRAAPGIGERLQPLTPSTTHAYLVMPDGGRIEFQAIRMSDPELVNQYWYTYKATAIIDPYGSHTTLIYNTDGSLNTIQEPGGRWIQLVYRALDHFIDYVQASDGRVVQYIYGQASFAPEAPAYIYLGNVVYFGDNSLTASYSYQAPNGPNVNAYPLLSTADDPMYGGPMKQIAYSYATSNGDPLIHVVAGQILSENNATSGAVVSQLYIPYVTWRTEIRGDGPSRVFDFSNGPLLYRHTDFNDQYATLGYDSNSYPSAMTDRNQNTTDITNNALNGNPTQVLSPSRPQTRSARVCSILTAAPVAPIPITATATTPIISTASATSGDIPRFICATRTSVLSKWITRTAGWRRSATTVLIKP